MVNTYRPPGSLALLTRLSKIVYRRSSDELLGMTLRHFVTLSYLRDHPNAPQQDLGDVFCVDASNLVLLLNELEAEDLVQRRRDPGDRRRHLVTLTPTGIVALDRAEQAQEVIEAEILQTLNPAERATLRSLLARALADVEPSSEQPDPVSVASSDAGGRPRQAGAGGGLVVGAAAPGAAG
jgi:DNA-binding MarR family transcriptional regulator